MLNTILQETILLERQLSHQEIKDLLTGKEKTKKIITDIYGNGESLPSNILNNPIVDKVVSTINALYKDLPYLVMKGEIITKENDKINLYIVYLLLDKNLSTQKRQSYLSNIVSEIGDKNKWNILGEPCTIPKLVNKSIVVKYYGNEISLNPELLGVQKNNRREIKISDISRYYFDEDNNTLILVNAKPIRQVTRENVPIGSGGVDSISLETMFQFQLKYAYWLLFKSTVNNIDYEFVGKGIKINKTVLENIISNILSMLKSGNGNDNVELRYLKDNDNDSEYFELLKNFLNYISVNHMFDEYVILDYSKEIDEFPQNILVQYKLLQSIREQIKNKKMFIVSESILKLVSLNENQKSRLLENIVTNNVEGISEILKNIKIPELSQIQKLYFQLLSIDKNQISSGDLYIIVEDNRDGILLDEYITIEGNVIKIDNSFDYNNPPITMIYPISYKKLEGQRLGKFTLNDDVESKRKGMKNVSIDEIDNQFSLSISEVYKKYFTTISLSEFNTFVKNLRKIIKNITNNNDVDTLKNIRNIVKSKESEFRSDIEQQDKKQEQGLIQLVKSTIERFDDTQEISRIDILFKKVLNNFGKSVDKTVSEIYDNKIKRIIEGLLTLILLLDSLEDFVNTINIKDDRVTLESLNKLDLIINYLNLIESTLFKVIDDTGNGNSSKYLKKLNSILNKIRLFENNENNIKQLVKEIDKIRVFIKEFSDKIFSSLVQTLYQYLYILSIDNLVVQTEIILDIINRQLKLNVKITYKNYTLKFVNSYFITQDFGTGELPYLFDKEFVQTISDDRVLYIDETGMTKKSRQQISMYASIVNLTDFEIVYNNTNNIQIETKDENDKILGFELLVNNIYDKLLDFITQINQNKRNRVYDLTPNEIDSLISNLTTFRTDLENLEKKTNISISSVFIITITLFSDSDDSRKIEISFLFRDFGSSLTSELQDFRIVRY